MVHGNHRKDEIDQYTVGEFRAYTRAAERCRRQALRDAAITARAAQFDQKEFGKYIDALTD